MRTINTLQHTTELALHMCTAYAKDTSVAVDCTCGNGHDTLWLAKKCAKVYAFDVQESAIENTGKLLRENSVDNVVLIKESHTKIKDFVRERPDVIIFNLGFLPGGNKTITTEGESSMKAIEEALDVLAVDGILSVTMYPGHNEGRREQEMILEWAKTLDSRSYHCVFASMHNQSDKAPQVLWITKKR